MLHVWYCKVTYAWSSNSKVH